MLDTEGLITKLRNIIADGTTLALTDVYSPELPQEKENICAVTILGGTALNNLCSVENYDITGRVIIRGTSNDTTTRALTDNIYNSINLVSGETFNDSKIIQILAQVPVFVGKDNDLRNTYNITFRIKVKEI